MRVLSDMTGDQRPEIDERVHAAVRVAETGDYEAAERAFDDLIRQGHPDGSPRAAAAWGELLRRAERLEDAERVLQFAVDSGHPDWSPSARVTLGLIHASRGDTAAAEAQYRAVAEAGHPQYAPRAWFSLGTMHQRHRETQRAVSAYRKVLAADHSEYTARAALNLGFMLFNQFGDIAGAEQAFRTAIEVGQPDQARMAALNLAAMRHLTQSGPKGIRYAAVDDGPVPPA